MDGWLGSDLVSIFSMDFTHEELVRPFTGAALEKIEIVADAWTHSVRSLKIPLLL